MTILDMLTNMHENNVLISKALEIIKDDFTGVVNDNYELNIDDKGDLIVQVPSLQKRDEFVYNSVTEYEYQLVMCMRVAATKNPDKYKFMLGKFMELYKEKLELFFKDVNTVDLLMGKIKKTKNQIDYATYASIAVMALGSISLCVFQDMSQTVRHVIVALVVLFPVLGLLLQFSKEGQVKKVIDGYLSIIKTEWYSKELAKQYAFLCNFAG